MGKEWEGRGGVTGRHRTEVSRLAAVSVSRVSTKDFFFNEMFATVHAAGSSLLGYFTSCATFDSTEG